MSNSTTVLILGDIRTPSGREKTQETTALIASISNTNAFNLIEMLDQLNKEGLADIQDSLLSITVDALENCSCAVFVPMEGLFSQAGSSGLQHDSPILGMGFLLGYAKALGKPALLYIPDEYHQMQYVMVDTLRQIHSIIKGEQDLTAYSFDEMPSYISDSLCII